jgi:hypothetical protein
MKLNPAWIVRKRRMKAWAEVNGVIVPSGLRMTPYCGKACRDLIRRIQIKAGLPLKDGKWRDDIRKLVTPRQTARSKAVRIALSQKGVKEHPFGSNSGPKVKEYQASTSLGGTGWPWCAAFCSWSFERAGRRLTGWNTAYVPDYVSVAKAGKHGLSVVDSSQVIPGDLACFDWQGDGECDHIGIVVTKVRSGGFQCIEGNTSYGNDSNGGQVMLRDRNVNSVGCFIRVS